MSLGPRFKAPKQSRVNWPDWVSLTWGSFGGFSFEKGVIILSVSLVGSSIELSYSDVLRATVFRENNN